MRSDNVGGVNEIDDIIFISLLFLALISVIISIVSLIKSINLTKSFKGSTGPQGDEGPPGVKGDRGPNGIDRSSGQDPVTGQITGYLPVNLTQRGNTYVSSQANFLTQTGVNFDLIDNNNVNATPQNNSSRFAILQSYAFNQFGSGVSPDNLTAGITQLTLNRWLERERYTDKSQSSGWSNWDKF